VLAPGVDHTSAVTPADAPETARVRRSAAGASRRAPPVRADRPELTAEARLAQIESLAQVRWAMLETSGKISFLTGEQSGGGEPANAEDPPVR
jgi:hypothetical protein